MWAILILVGFLAGVYGSLLGLGGGIIIVPSLLYLAQSNSTFEMITPQIAVGTSLLMIVSTSLSSIMVYAEKKRVDFASGWVFFIAMGPGTLIGSYLTSFFQTDSFMVAFGLIMMFISILLLIQDRIRIKTLPWNMYRSYTDSEGKMVEYGFHLPTALILLLFIGVLSGMFGIGGGALMIPMMLLLFRFPPHIATATSMFIVFLSAIVGSGYHVLQGNIHWLAVLLLAPSTWLGGQLGAWISNRISGRLLLRIFRMALFFISIYIILDAIL